jgi:hypothetical protein
MKRFFRLACLALVAIAASVSLASCNKSDDNNDKGSTSALGLVYGFSKDVYDNYDLTITYTNAEGKEVTESIKKDGAEQFDSIMSGNTYTVYELTKSIAYTKSIANGKISFSATKKASSVIDSSNKYNLAFSYGYGAVKATTAKIKKAALKYRLFTNKNILGEKVDEAVTKRLAAFKTTFNVDSDGAISFVGSSMTE